MGFYWTIVYDLPDERIIVMKPGANAIKTHAHAHAHAQAQGQAKATGEVTSNGKSPSSRAKKDD